MTEISSAPIVGIVADDVTGATDSVVQFSRAGWSARLLLGGLLPEQVDPGSALAVNSDARALMSAAAREVTASAVADVVTAGATHLYVKIDSTMRGSVEAQLVGALDAWRGRHPDCFAVVCPAYPAMGRTVEDGLLRVHGGPVENSPAGRDPVTPVPTSRLTDLLPGTTTVSLTGSPEKDAEVLRTAANSGVVVVNAASDGDLRVLAAALVAAGPAAIPAGSAGLAAAMATAWADASAVLADPEPPPAPQGARIVVLVSSLHDVARAQTEHLRSHLDPASLKVLQPDVALLHEPDRLATWADAELADGENLPRVVVVLSPDVTGTGAAALSGAELARRLAIMVQRTLDSTDAGALVLVGGDGARAVLDSTGAKALRITGAIEEGIPLGVAEGGTAAGKIIVTKAGGFGPVTALLHTVDELNRILTTTPAHSLEASS